VLLTDEPVGNVEAAQAYLTEIPEAERVVFEGLMSESSILGE